VNSQADYKGDECIVLPTDYLNSAKAVSEIFEDELSKAASDLHVDNLGTEPGFFSGTITATVLWVLPSVWMVCQ
jgi:hypothetical protein